MGDRNRSRRVYSFYRAPPAPATDGTTIIVNGGGVTQSQLTGIWIDSGSIAGMKTTGSISIDSNFPTSGGRNANQIGTDVYFFVSGSSAPALGKTASAKVTVLPDTQVSGALYFGGQQIFQNPGSGIEAFYTMPGATGTFTRIWGSANGHNITLNAGINAYQCQAGFYHTFQNNAAQEQLRIVDMYPNNWGSTVVNPFGATFGTDVSLFVSGSVGAASGNANRRVAAFATDIVSSGSLVVSGTLDTGIQIKLNSIAGGQYPATSFGAVGVKAGQNIIGARYNGTDYTLMSWDTFGDLIFGADTSFLNSAASNYMCSTAAGSVYYLFGGLTTWQLWTNSGNNSALTAYRSALDTLINQRSQDSDVATRKLIINAQGAFGTPSTVANARGGNILLVGGQNEALGFFGSSSLGGVVVTNNQATAIAGTDVMLFVSGSTGVASGVNRRVAVFGGDVVFSGTVSLPANTSFNTYTSGTWRDAGNALVSTSSVSIDLSNRAASTLGTDVFFFVSGSNGVGSGPNRKMSVHGGDVYISGSLVIGTGSMPTVTGAIALSNGSIIVQRLTNGTNAYMMQVNTNNDIIYGGIGSGNNTNNYQASTHVFYNVTSNILGVNLRQLQFGDSSMIIGLANTNTAYAVSMQANGNASSGSNGANLSFSAANANSNGAGGDLILVGGNPSANGLGAGRVIIAPDNALSVAAPTRIVFEGITSTLQDRNWVALCGNAGSRMVEGNMPQGTGNFVTYVGNASVIPNTSATNGALLYSVTGTLATRDATSELLLGKQICWSSGTVAPILTQASSTLGNGQNLTVAAQPALSGSGNNGGNLILSGGASGFISNGRAGNVTIATQTGSLEFTGLRCAVSSAAGVIGNPGPAYYMEVYYTSGSIQRFHGAVPIYTFAPLNSGSV